MCNYSEDSSYSLHRYACASAASTYILTAATVCSLPVSKWPVSARHAVAPSPDGIGAYPVGRLWFCLCTGRRDPGG